jgi:hypothetical protein
MVTDSFPIKEIDDIIYEIESKMIVKREGDYGISSNTDEDAAEGATAESILAGEQTVNSLVDGARLVQTGYDKKSYMLHIKGYMKKLSDYLKDNNPDRVDAFQKGAQNFVKKILQNFGEYSFYTGSSMDPEGMVALMFYREDGVTPVFYLWKDGLRMEKV